MNVFKISAFYSLEIRRHVLLILGRRLLGEGLLPLATPEMEEELPTNKKPPSPALEAVACRQGCRGPLALRSGQQDCQGLFRQTGTTEMPFLDKEDPDDDDDDDTGPDSGDDLDEDYEGSYEEAMEEEENKLNKDSC